MKYKFPKLSLVEESSFYYQIYRLDTKFNIIGVDFNDKNKKLTTTESFVFHLLKVRLGRLLPF